MMPVARTKRMWSCNFSSITCAGFQEGWPSEFSAFMGNSQTEADPQSPSTDD